MASSPWTMIHSVVSSRSASLEKVSLPSMDRPPRAGGLTSSTTSLSRPMVTLSPATGTLRLGQVAGSDQLVGLANAPASCACAPAARKPERADKRSNERDSFRTASTPKRKKDPGILRPQRIARSWGIPHGTAAKAVPASHHSSVNPFLLATSAPPQVSRQTRLLVWLPTTINRSRKAMLHRFFLLAAVIYVSVPLPAHAQAQQEPAGAVRGHIADSVTGRAVPTATVHLVRNQRIFGTAEADTAGEFSFDDVPEGVYSVEVEEQGYLKAVQADVRVVLRRVAPVEFALVRAGDEEFAEVVVSARATSEDPRATPNTVLLEREEIRRNPGSAGDVFRALDILPGVVATGEFSNFTVRGNGPRDNLILVDGIPFDKVTHFDESLGEQADVDGSGNYSIFAPNIIGSARFSPGGWRAAEGGKNGSLLDLEIARGNPASSTAGLRLDIIGI